MLRMRNPYVMNSPTNCIQTNKKTYLTDYFTGMSIISMSKNKIYVLFFLYIKNIFNYLLWLEDI